MLWALPPAVSQIQTTSDTSCDSRREICGIGRAIAFVYDSREIYRLTWVQPNLQIEQFWCEGIEKGSLMALLFLLIVGIALSLDKQSNELDQAQLEAYEAIVDSPSPWHETDPLALIHAVNELHELGFERSCEVLYLYFRRHGILDPTNPIDSTGRASGDLREELVYSILLNVNPESHWFARWYPCDCVACRGINRKFQYVVFDGIPFSLTRPYADVGVITHTGIPNHNDSAVFIREDPLMPSDNPFAAADELLTRFERIEDLDHILGYRTGLTAKQSRQAHLDVLRHHVRAQVVQLIHGEYEEVSEEDWQELVEWARHGNIRWNAEAQQYDLLSPSPFHEF